MGEGFAVSYIKSHITRFALAILLVIVFISILFCPTVASAAVDVTLAWDASSGADGYRLFYRQEGQSYNYNSPDWEGPGTTCTVYGLDDSTTYHFVVRAYNGDGESGNSNEETLSPASNPVIVNTNVIKASSIKAVMSPKTAQVPTRRPFWFFPVRTTKSSCAFDNIIGFPIVHTPPFPNPTKKEIINISIFVWKKVSGTRRPHNRKLPIRYVFLLLFIFFRILSQIGIEVIAPKRNTAKNNVIASGSSYCKTKIVVYDIIAVVIVVATRKAMYAA